MKYFLLQDGRKGPYSLCELQQLRVRPDQLILPEGFSVWQLATQLEELAGYLADSPSPAPPALPPTFLLPPAPTSTDHSAPSPSTAQSPKWNWGWVTGFAITLMLSTKAINGCRSSNNGSSPVPQQVASTRGQTTYEYWFLVHAILGRLLSKDDRGPQDYFTEAKYLEKLPVVGVDNEALECGAAYADLLRTIGNFAERTNSPAAMSNAFIRGLQGDMFGEYNELRAAEQRIAEQAEEVHRLCRTARQTLSQRYKTEFPPSL
jgi:hypothetical protein